MIPMELAGRKCTPCRGGVPPLGPEKAAEFAARVPSWELQDGRIRRRFQLKDFPTALQFVNDVGSIAEAEGHHPDIRIFGWNKVELELYTHKIGGLHENDFIVAAKIDALAAERGIH